MAKIDELLIYSMKEEASDIHLTSGHPPVLRCHGRLRTIKSQPLKSNDIWNLIAEIATDEDRDRIKSGDTFTFAYEMVGTGDRFRVNVYPEQRGLAAAIRHLAARPPSFEDLKIPKLVPQFITGTWGIVLVVGATGAGKSSTLAACVNEVNKTENKHIISLENPIEYRYENGEALIHQREVPRHARDFSSGIVEALRQDPDILVVGEIRSREEITRALLAAETGHLVLTTLHANSAPKAIDRMVSVFNPDEQPMIRMILSETIRLVVAQKLLPTTDGKGRRAALERMVGTSPVRALIREGKTHQILSSMQSSGPRGHITMNQAIAALVREGAISRQVAEDHSPDVQELGRLLGGGFR